MGVGLWYKVSPSLLGVEANRLPSAGASVLTLWMLCRIECPFVLRADPLMGQASTWGVTGDVAPALLHSASTLCERMTDGPSLEPSRQLTSPLILQMLIVLYSLRVSWPVRAASAPDLPRDPEDERIVVWLLDRAEGSQSQLVEYLLQYSYDIERGTVPSGWVDQVIDYYTGRFEYLLDSTNGALDAGTVLLHDEVGNFCLVTDNGQPSWHVYIFDESCINLVKQCLLGAPVGDVMVHFDEITGIPDHLRRLRLGEEAGGKLTSWVYRLPVRLFAGY